jgi:hypothetical protein
MEFLILLAMCTVVIGGVAWFGRQRRPDVEDAGLAAKANADAERQRWDGPKT